VLVGTKTPRLTQAVPTRDRCRHLGERYSACCSSVSSGSSILFLPRDLISREADPLHLTRGVTDAPPRHDLIKIGEF
jgi:hypothetical protein